MNNLKQVGFGLRLFAADHDDHLPPQVSVSKDGSLQLVGQGSPAAHFQTLSNYIRTPKVWVCPTDTTKKPIGANVPLADSNVSYFLSMDAEPTNARPQFVILAGDRHLEVGHVPVKPSLFVLTTHQGIGWTRELHAGNAQSTHGTMLFLDGHTEFLKNTQLDRAVRNQGLATNRLAVP